MTSEKIEKTESEWRELFTEEEFRVTRQAGTEAPFLASTTCMRKRESTPVFVVMWFS